MAIARAGHLYKEAEEKERDKFEIGDEDFATWKKVRSISVGA